MGYFHTFLAFLAATSSIANATPTSHEDIERGSPLISARQVSTTCTDCCGASSFSGTPPPWANEPDCLAMIFLLPPWAAPTTWIVPQNMRVPILSHGSCGFWAETDYNVGDISITRYIGSQDVSDLLSSAINMYGRVDNELGA